ncbi:hypothetical protein MRB53_039880 [Persea americana]|nr:hypothetical protein MRB53_039880 [Persea americana]
MDRFTIPLNALTSRFQMNGRFEIRGRTHTVHNVPIHQHEAHWRVLRCQEAVEAAQFCRCAESRQLQPVVFLKQLRRAVLHNFALLALHQLAASLRHPPGRRWDVGHWQAPRRRSRDWLIPRHRKPAVHWSLRSRDHARLVREHIHDSLVGHRRFWRQYPRPCVVHGEADRDGFSRGGSLAGRLRAPTRSPFWGRPPGALEENARVTEVYEDERPWMDRPSIGGEKMHINLDHFEVFDEMSEWQQEMQERQEYLREVALDRIQRAKRRGESSVALTREELAALEDAPLPPRLPRQPQLRDAGGPSDARKQMYRSSPGPRGRLPGQLPYPDLDSMRQDQEDYTSTTSQRRQPYVDDDFQRYSSAPDLRSLPDEDGWTPRQNLLSRPRTRDAPYYSNAALYDGGEQSSQRRNLSGPASVMTQRIPRKAPARSTSGKHPNRRPTLHTPEREVVDLISDDDESDEGVPVYPERRFEEHGDSAAVGDRRQSGRSAGSRTGHSGRSKTSGPRR